AALRDALLRGEGAAAIGRLGLQGADPLAAESVDLFVECYGSVAGDHALTTLASGGVYVTGGIAARLLPKLTAGGFLHAFNDKGAFRALTETFPVAAASEDRIGLYGATRIAACGMPDDGN
ncbi:MAG TPA: glucokinase, partial [Casimicrobiaceae bacterium]|nr:glucokinase [Casimicrobiaceae bacterium]